MHQVDRIGGVADPFEQGEMRHARLEPYRQQHQCCREGDEAGKGQAILHHAPVEDETLHQPHQPQQRRAIEHEAGQLPQPPFQRHQPQPGAGAEGQRHEAGIELRHRPFRLQHQAHERQGDEAQRQPHHARPRAEKGQ